jgi:hypothetical protein
MYYVVSQAALSHFPFNILMNSLIRFKEKANNAGNIFIIRDTKVQSTAPFVRTVGTSNEVFGPINWEDIGRNVSQFNVHLRPLRVRRPTKLFFTRSKKLGKVYFPKLIRGVLQRVDLKTIESRPIDNSFQPL